MSEKVYKVAVITRTKDRAILLERAIKSIHQQTMKDFIHVIINDAGDSSVVDELVDRYKDVIKGRIKVIHNVESHGMEAASNKAIKSVNSLYVAIHDDDDSWHPDFLKLTTQYMDSTAARGVVAITDRLEESIAGNGVQELRRERWMPHLRTLRLYDLCLANFAVPISFIYQRGVYDEIGYYDESLPVCGDWDFALRFMRLYDIDLLHTDYALAYYHHRPNTSGALGNSVFAGADKHEKYNTILANKYLREDVASGGLGLGYLFNRRAEEKAITEQLSHRYDELGRNIEDLKHLTVERTDYKKKAKALVNRVSPALYKGLKKIRSGR